MLVIWHRRLNTTPKPTIPRPLDRRSRTVPNPPSPQILLPGSLFRRVRLPFSRSTRTAQCPQVKSTLAPFEPIQKNTSRQTQNQVNTNPSLSTKSKISESTQINTILLRFRISSPLSTLKSSIYCGISTGFPHCLSPL